MNYDMIREPNYDNLYAISEVYGGGVGAIESMRHEWNAACQLEATRVQLKEASLVGLSVDFGAATSHNQSSRLH